MVFEKLLKKETVVESASFIFIFLIIERIIQTVRGIIFARMLGPTELGIFNLAFFFIPLMVAFAKLGIPSCYPRYASKYEAKGMLGDFFKKSYLLTICASIFITVISLIFAKQVSYLIYKSTDYKFIIILSSIMVLPIVMYENFIGTFNGIKIFKMGVLMRFMQFLGFTVLGTILVIIYPKAISIISANLLSFIIVLTLVGSIVWKYIINAKHQKEKLIENNFYKKIFLFSVWFTFTPVIDTLYNYSDRWMLNRFLGLSEVGIYSVAVNIAGILIMFGTIMGNVMAPSLSGIWEKGEKIKAISLMNLSMKINIIFLFFIAVILSLIKYEFVKILYGQVYIESISVLNIMMIFAILTSISSVLAGYPWLIEKPYIFVVNNVFGVTINLVLNYILIPHYHMKGAAIANNISYSISFVIMNLWLYKHNFRLKASTIILCLVPFSLVLSNIMISLIFLILISLVVSTDLIIEKEEKQVVYQQFKKAFSRFNISRNKSKSEKKIK